MVDIGRSTYRTLAHLYPDSDEVFEIEWYEALPDAPLLGTPSAINSLVWARDRDEYTPTAVGEIAGAPWIKTRYHRKPLAAGDHVCGTPEDFAGRGSIDTTSPPVTYRPDGLPTCCGDLVEGTGGLGLGDIPEVTTPNPVLGRVDSHSGDPPVHVCTRMTHDGTGVVIPYVPTTVYEQCWNPDECPWPDGALIALYEIAEFPGEYWGEPVIAYATTSTVTLAQDTSTDVVTADVVTQLSVAKDGGGVKLQNDSVPTAAEYYGTPSGGTSLGYQSFPAAVAAAAGNATTITALQLGIFGTLPQNGLTLIAGGGGVFFVGLDTVVASTTAETLVTDSSISTDDDALMTLSNSRTVFLNDFNAQALIINRRVGINLDDDSSVAFLPGPGISVVGDSGDQSITIGAEVQDSITIVTGGLALVGDDASPGASFLYSTDASGTKGWHVTDGSWLDMVGSTLSHVGPSTVGATTYAYPTSLVVDLHGHVYSATAGAQPVTSISTIDGTGGPLSGAVTLQGGIGITLSVSGSTVSIAGSGAGAGPPPFGAPTLTATPGNTQVTLSWTAAVLATGYALFNGSTEIFTGSGLSHTQTGLINGVAQTYYLYGTSGGVYGPGSTATATPVAPPPPPVRATSTGVNVLATTGFATPGAAVAGDLLIVCVIDLAGTGTTPAGWTKQITGGSGNGSGTAHIAAYTKTAAGGAETFALTGAFNFSAICLDLTKTIYDGSIDGGSQGTVSSTTIRATGLTPTGASDVGMVFYQIDGSTTISVPGTLTQGPTVAFGGSFPATLTAGYVLLSSGAAWVPGNATALAAGFSDSISVMAK